MDGDKLIVSRERHLGRIRLNRPRALNSLTLAMVRGLTDALIKFSRDPEIIAVFVTGNGERGFCAGGDIRALYDLRNKDKNPYRMFWREEYRLNAMIAAFAKPYIVLMDGVVMGGGVGISAHGSVRIVTERTRLAMPETGIGFVPDVGGTWLLTRNGGAGLYLALSGATAYASDALKLGLADVLINSSDICALETRLMSIELAADVKNIVKEFSQRPPKGELEEHRQTLDKAMSQERLVDILSFLEKSGSDFASKAAVEMAKNSPTSLKVTHALLKRARRADRLETCLLNEYRAATRLLETHDLFEGVRAAVIDKDRSPKWLPTTLGEVDDEEVANILRGDGGPEPVFPAVL